MKNCRTCKQLKDLEAFNRAKRNKDGRKSECRECQRQTQAKYRTNNKAVLLVKNKQWRDYNPHYYLNYYRKNKIKKDETSLRWAKNNPGKMNAQLAKRRASQLQATPKWLTKEQLDQIKEFYIYASLMTKTLEKPYEVDHIIPLKGKNVSGLHVPWNLQILPRPENRSKNNKVTGYPPVGEKK